MSGNYWRLLATAAILCAPAALPLTAGATCGSLSSLKIADLHITGLRPIDPAPSWTLPRVRGVTVNKPFAASKE